MVWSGLVWPGLPAGGACARSLGDVVAPRSWVLKRLLCSRAVEVNDCVLHHVNRVFNCKSFAVFTSNLCVCGWCLVVTVVASFMSLKVEHPSSS